MGDRDHSILILGDRVVYVGRTWHVAEVESDCAHLVDDEFGADGVCVSVVDTTKLQELRKIAKRV